MARPLSERAHEAVLAAALKLFAADGIDATSMDAIATEAQVSKATVYKHWRNKEALCLAVLDRLFAEPLPADTGDVRADIVALLKNQPQGCRPELHNRLAPQLAACARHNLDFGLAVRKRVLEPPRARLTELLHRAIKAGQLRPDLDVDLAVALLLGPMTYRHAMNLMNVPLPDNMAERVVEVFWKTHAPGT